jgi:CheY-like chemotaxis protein
MTHKLLLADDSVTIQRVIELTFADEDIQVIAVGDGKQAIERIETDRPDIVLADVGMPERNGYDVAAFVKNAAHLSHIPVLLLTGAFEPVDDERARAAGCDGVLVKPFEPQMVIARVKELLGAPSDDRLRRAGAWKDGTPEDDFAAPSPEGASDADQLAEWDATAAPPEGGAGLEAALDSAAASAGAQPAGDLSIRISRRTPIAVPGFGAPAPPPEPHSALDEYFDRLDAAFATLQQAPTAAPEAPEAAGTAGPPAPTPVDSRQPADSQAENADEGREPVRPVAAESGPVAAVAPRPLARVPGIAQAFTALFAAERGEAAGEVPAFIGPALLPEASLDELVERVTRQVMERMSDRVVRDTVTDVVSRVAERLVRDEIERVKATLK